MKKIRELAKRKERVAQLREQRAKIALERAQKAVRDKETEIESAEEEHRQQEKTFLSTHSGELGGGWLEVLEGSRTRHKDFLEKSREELAQLEQELEAVQIAHNAALREAKSSEKVQEKVHSRWEAEVRKKEGKELDEVASGRASRQGRSQKEDS